MAQGTATRDGAPAGPTVALRRSHLALVVAFWLAYVGLGAGLVSSNDGSHVALARALALRHETSIDPDVGLTLLVDRARHDGHERSDRPPGTAMLAVPAMWLGDRLDGPLATRSRARGALVVTPGGWPYLRTYAARVPDGPPLYRRQGTALLARIHAATVGAVGLLLLVVLAGRARLSTAATTVAVATLGGASLWGPYSTALFAHVTAGLGLLGLVTDLLLDRERPSPWLAIMAGAGGALAVAADYALVLAVIPLAFVLAPRRRLGLVALGAVPIGVVVATYHQAAFGSVLSIGYDHHVNFEFARSRWSTFDGNPLLGLWTLWGAGRGAGVLAMAPILLVGVWGLWRWKPGISWAVLPWVLLLCFHHTPWGGAGMDHRYLVPLLPLLAVGVGWAWDRMGQSTRGRVALLVLMMLSVALVWSHFLTWTRT